MNIIVFRDADGHEETANIATVSMDVVPRIGEEIEFDKAKASARYNSKFSKWVILKVKYMVTQYYDNSEPEVYVTIKPIG